MGRQALGARALRRYSRVVGAEVVSAVARGGSHWVPFVTIDHRHGLMHSSRHVFIWQDDPIHFSSCRERFPDDC